MKEPEHVTRKASTHLAVGFGRAHEHWTTPDSVEM